MREEAGSVCGTDLVHTPSPRGTKARGVLVTPLPLCLVSDGLLNRAPFPWLHASGEQRPTQAFMHVSIHPF